MGQRLVHIINDVQPLRGYDGVLLSPQIASERLQTDLVWKKTKDSQSPQRGRINTTLSSKNVFRVKRSFKKRKEKHTLVHTRIITQTFKKGF